MYPPHLLYLMEKGTTWFNPAYGLVGFWEERKKVQNRLNLKPEEVWGHRELKRAKEIFAISILASVMSKQEGSQWWIHKPESDPPDGVIGTMVKKNGRDEMHGREVEVVEDLEGDILGTIREKLSKKRYEPNTILACYLSKGGLFDAKQLHEVISKEATSLDHIFLLFPGAGLENISPQAQGEDLIRVLFNFNSIQIKPIYSHMSINPIDDTAEWRKGNQGTFFIFEGKGKSNFRPITLENPPKLF